MTKFVFLGRLEDAAGAPEMTLKLQEPTPLSEVLRSLPESLAAALTGPKVRVAINGAVVSGQAPMIEDADEVAFLPPVSGG